MSASLKNTDLQTETIIKNHHRQMDRILNKYYEALIDCDDDAMHEAVEQSRTIFLNTTQALSSHATFQQMQQKEKA